MRSLLPFVLAAALGGCGKPKAMCAKYGDMESKCANIPEGERASTRTLARGMCEAAASSDHDVATAGEPFAREAECAQSTEDGTEYRACVETKR